jgi:hypothetical protein
MPDPNAGRRQVIPQDVMLARLARSEQVPEFFSRCGCRIRRSPPGPAGGCARCWRRRHRPGESSYRVHHASATKVAMAMMA